MCVWGGYSPLTAGSVQDCWTALISAAREGHLEVVKELLENNANLEHRDMVRVLLSSWTREYQEYCCCLVARETMRLQGVPGILLLAGC